MVKIAEYDDKAAADKGAVLVLRHPVTKDILYGEDGKTTAEIMLLGADSQAYRDFIRARTRVRIKKADREGSLSQALNFDGNEREDAELYATITQGWSGMEKDDGSELVFSFEAAVELYLTQTWIREQVSRGTCAGGRGMSSCSRTLTKKVLVSETTFFNSKSLANRKKNYTSLNLIRWCIMFGFTTERFQQCAAVVALAFLPLCLVSSMSGR